MHLKITAALCIATLVAAASCVNAQDQSSGNAQTQPGSETVFKIGHGVTAPRVIHQSFPEFSEQARAAHYQGTCVLSLVVGADGKPRDVKVTQPLGMGLDEKAVESVSTWRFEPAQKDGKPVAVAIAVDVDFHLYGKNDRKMVELMKQAAGGDAKAELELSTAYFHGQDIARSDALGLQYLERAARHGLPHAQFLMGEHIAHESAPDYPKAYMWYTLGQRGGYKHSDKALKELASKMTTEQLQAGQELVDKWTNAQAK